MHRQKILQELSLYSDSLYITKEERPALEELKRFIQENPLCFERSNKGHVTGSFWLINNDGSKALLMHHKKLGMWLQLGGHADGDPHVKQVALKEAEEESGIQGLTFALEGIFDVDIHPIPGPCSYHYDIRYLLQTTKSDIFEKNEESLDLQWVAHANIKNYSQERSVLRMAEKFQTLTGQQGKDRALDQIKQA